MEAQSILLKTPRGREEIGTRAHDLGTLARRLLIMADGRQTVAELAAVLDRSPDDVDLQRAVQTLLDGYYLLVEDDYAQWRYAASGRG